MADTGHTCSYSCTIPEHVREQRDWLVKECKLLEEQLQSAQHALEKYHKEKFGE